MAAPIIVLTSLLSDGAMYVSIQSFLSGTGMLDFCYGSVGAGDDDASLPAPALGAVMVEFQLLQVSQGTIRNALFAV